MAAGAFAHPAPERGDPRVSLTHLNVSETWTGWKTSHVPFSACWGRHRAGSSELRAQGCQGGCTGLGAEFFYFTIFFTIPVL